MFQKNKIHINRTNYGLYNGLNPDFEALLKSQGGRSLGTKRLGDAIDKIRENIYRK